MIDIGRVGLWTSLLDLHPTTRVKEVVAELESLGWPCVWRPETSGRDALVSAAVMLEATSTMRIATGIAQIHARHPLTTRAGQKTLHEAYGGRFLLGLGVSHAPSTQARGHDYGRPLSAMRSYLEAMEGAPWRAAPGTQPPPPAPVVLAALGPRMLELARERTAGAHPYFVPVEHTRMARAVLGAGPLLVPEQAVVLAPDRRAARAIGDRHMSQYLSLDNYRNNLRRLGWAEAELAPPGSDSLFDAIVAWGDEAAVAERVRQHVEAGADSVLLQPLTATPEVPYLEELRRLGAVAQAG